MLIDSHFADWWLPRYKQKMRKVAATRRDLCQQRRPRCVAPGTRSRKQTPATSAGMTVEDAQAPGAATETQSAVSPAHSSRMTPSASAQGG
jgi:hypothetical protein